MTFTFASQVVAAIFTSAVALSTIAFGTTAYARDVYVSNYNSGTISVFDSGGAFRFSFASGGTNPTGLAFDAAGNLYVANRGSKNIVKFNAAGTNLGVFATTDLAPQALAFDANGNLFASAYYDNAILKINPAGLVSTFSTAGINIPVGVAFGANGNLYVANQASARSNNRSSISILSPNGDYLGLLASSDVTLLPSSIAFDASGNLYDTVYNNGRIDRIQPNGTVTAFTTSYTRAGGIAFTANGDVLVSDFGTDAGGGNAIRRYSSTGADLGIFAAGNMNGPSNIAISDSPLLPVRTVVPEPGTLLLLLPAVGLITARRRACAK